ncbi:ROK family glucokinase [Paenibacillus sp. CECT 9249]|uniref:ROK family glucokinase n=1 Tax=Paenibacillus sp. CECT 9249 TaxID=2845385 RepID=UPI0025B6EF65|nr:ROK family glucokinase [Paenibacillus sp. CECT 9249]
MDETMIGIDIGGTTVKIGLLTKEGDIAHKWEIPTNRENLGKHIVDDIWRSVSSKLTELHIAKDKLIGIGVGAPGFTDKNTGVVHEAVNVGWKNYDLGAQLQERSGLPVFVENDANMVALGENWKGGGNRAKDLIAITLGTGVGSGIIANGEILSGTNGTAGEIGHIIADPNGYPCNCGRTGCLDTVASATGIVRQAMEQMKDDPNGALAALYSNKGTIDAKDVFDAARQGDPGCERVIRRIADLLGFVLAGAAAVINPSIIVIGGGVSQAGDQLLRPVIDSFRTYSLPRISRACEINIARLGNDAGMIGAAYLVMQQTQKGMYR